MSSWSTPTLDALRTLNANNVIAKLKQPGVQARAMIPNSIARVLADSNAGLAFLTLLYIDYLAMNLLPNPDMDPIWLARWADIWLKNYGGGQKAATFASGSVTATGQTGIIIPLGQQINGPVVTYQTTEQATLGAGPVTISIVALTAGVTGDAIGTVLDWSPAVSGSDGTATISVFEDGINQESFDELLARLLLRIQQPPMGGDASDYEQWALSVPGVTRAWCSPLEMGVGTVTVRVMMDDVRAATGGFPTQADVATVQAYLNTKRPVTAIDVFVVAPIPEPISFTLKNLNAIDPGTMANISASVSEMLAAQGAPASANNGKPIPAQTIYAAWVNEAIMNAIGVSHFDLVMADWVMPTPSSIATLGNILLA